MNKNIQIENAQIRFRNFSGKQTQFNPEGRRNFCVLLENDVAESLTRDGWNVRYLKPRDPEDPTQAYMQVSLSFKNYPPKIVVISSRNQTHVEEDTVNMLDWAEIKLIDMIIRPYSWEVSGKSGIKAYLKTMYVTLVEDDFEGRYVEVPNSEDSDPDDN